jgi:hypothetical protein
MTEENKTETKTPFKWKPKFKAQYSMGELDYMRYDIMLKMSDEFRIRTICRDSSAIEPYYAVLNTLYANWRQLIIDLNKFDELFEKMNKALKDWKAQTGIKTFPITLAEMLLNVHRDLLCLKQIIGLGIPVQKDEKFGTKARRALLGNI